MIPASAGMAGGKRGHMTGQMDMNRQERQIFFLGEKRFTKQRNVYTEILTESFVSYFVSVQREKVSWDLYHDEPVNSTSSSACQEQSPLLLMTKSGNKHCLMYIADFKSHPICCKNREQSTSPWICNMDNNIYLAKSHSKDLKWLLKTYLRNSNTISIFLRKKIMVSRQA